MTLLKRQKVRKICYDWPTARHQCQWNREDLPLIRVCSRHRLIRQMSPPARLAIALELLFSRCQGNKTLRTFWLTGRSTSDNKFHGMTATNETAEESVDNSPASSVENLDHIDDRATLRNGDPGRSITKWRVTSSPGKSVECLQIATVAECDVIVTSRFYSHSRNAWPIKIMPIGVEFNLFYVCRSHKIVVNIYCVLR